MPRNRELDRLRGFAVLITVYIHVMRMFFPWNTTPHYRGGTTILNVWSNPWNSVDLFLVISGYIITKLLVTDIDPIDGNRVGLAQVVKAFYGRRFFRIYPVAWTVFFFVLLASMFLNEGGMFGTPVNTVEAGVSIFTYTFNFFFAGGLYHAFPLAPYWSLAVEEQFYLIFPLFLLLIKGTRRRVLCLSAMLLLTTFVIRPLTPGEQSIWYTQCRCDGLLYGSLIYFVTRQPWFSAIRISTPPNPWLGQTLVLLLLAVLAALPGIGLSNALVLPVSCALASALVFIAACESEVICFPVSIQRILDYFGKRSYSLYVVHAPMLVLTQELIQRYAREHFLTVGPGWEPVYVAIGVPLAALAAETLHRTVERPFLAIGKTWSARILSSKYENSSGPTAESRVISA
ncbi:MAG TPA: acyltransferase [Steroidobacteraceae bacterium]